MKAILEFNLPEESEDHHFALEGVSYYLVVEAVLSELRCKLKYEEHPEAKDQAYEEIRNFIINELNERNLNRG